MSEEQPYQWRRLAPDALPGQTLFEHPDDVRLGSDERVWEILHVILPDGDIGALGIPGPWGQPLEEATLAAAREDCIEKAGQSGAADGDGGGTISVLTRDYRIEKR